MTKRIWTPDRRITTPRRQRGFLLNPYRYALSGPAGITVDAAEFTALTDYMVKTSNLTSIADSKTGILSYWVRVTSWTNDFQMHVFEGAKWNTTFNFNHDFITSYVENGTGSNMLVWVVANNNVGGGSNILVMKTTTEFAGLTTWIHVLASWDLTGPATHLYINDVANKTTNTATNNDIPYTAATRWRVGGYDTGAGPTNFNDVGNMDGSLAEVYFAPGQYLDFSNVTNRRLFRTAAGKPADLLSDGSGPTGTVPKIYCHLNDAEAVANFRLNRSGNGDFTVGGGTLATAATSPSD